jgi:hypothetical protein
VFVNNQVAGISANNVVDVQIANNTMYARTGDNVRLDNLAREIEVRGNNLWVDSGTNIFVADNTRSGFFSDYNQLHATGTGKLIHWMREFTDILDWQLDVSRYDLHSIGRTAVNPLAAEPAFVSIARGDYQVWILISGLRKTSPSIDVADPRSDVGVPASFINLLANPSFESGITGWTANVQASNGAPNGPAFHGATYFVPGAVATGVAEQTIDLIAAGHSAAQLDSQNLVAVFGGRVRSKLETPIDTANITLEFRDGSGAIIASRIAGAANVGDRWDLVGDRISLPTGTRRITFRFESIRATGTTNDAHLDNAFVYVLSEAVAPDAGVFGHIDGELPSAGVHLAMKYPDLHVDWQRDVARTIRWQSYDNAANLPVRIDLLQDGVHGPQVVATIATSTPDDGEFIWTPANSGVNFDTPGLRISVSLVGDSMAFDRAQESFTVPDNSTTFFVDDTSNANDEYTPGAVGANRNTGKRADVPKPHPVNLLRAYDLPPSAVVSIDTGDYPLFDAVRISGSQDLGLGIEEAFVLRGPTDLAKDVTIQWIYPDGHPQSLIELFDADFMTLANLDLVGSQRGLWVTGGSDNFNASHITARNQSLDAIDITPLNPAANFVGLVAENAGRHGIVIAGEFASLSDVRAANNVDTGIKLSASGTSRVEAMEVFGNRAGIDVSNSVVGTQTTIGNENLALGRGNKVYNNSNTGIFANSNALVAGNVVHGHNSPFNGAIFVNGATSEVARNIVFSNQRGIQVSGVAAVRENRVYGNLTTGIHADNNVPILANVVYDNPTGIQVNASSALVANNLIYGNDVIGLKLIGGSPDIVNNTIYQTAGTGLRSDAVTNLEQRNNIVWAVGGAGLSIGNDSQVRLASDFNLLFASGAGVVGTWLGANQATLQQWHIATGKDANSLSNNPLFVDLDGADNVLGFVSNISEGFDDDFHLQSPFGSLHGGSLAPVRSATTGLPVFPVGALVNDAALSPAIDRGSGVDAFANEPTPNGGFINLGADGNTSQASRSPAPLLLMLDPNGGEIVAQGSTFPIRWRASGFAGNVRLEVSSTGASGPFQVLSANEVDDGVFDWAVSAATFSASSNYFLRISSVAQPSVFDVSDAAFQVSVPNTTYYVNDASIAGDEYTTAVGSAANSGLSPASPMASIQAVLNAYDLGPGDVIFVDTGNYAVTANIVIDAVDSGVRIQGPVQGAHIASLNRGNASAGSFVFQLQNATNVTLDSLEIFGANEGVLVNLASHDFAITNSIVRNNAARGVHIEDTANRAVIADSEIHSQPFPAFGIEIEGDDAIVRNNVIRNNASLGINITNTAANTIVQANDLFANATAIQTNQPTAVPSGLRIEANSVHGNNANFAITVIGAGLIVDNDVFANQTVVAIEASGDFTEVRSNRVHDNTQQGIRVTQGAIARDNVVFGNNNGIETGSGKVYNNTIYANGKGIVALGNAENQIGNNVIYANTAFGIDQTGQPRSNIFNNTFYQLTGDAIRNILPDGTTFTAADFLSATNNIFVVGAGAALNISASAQSVFSSDHNLFQVVGSGRIATWGTTAISSWQDWQFATGRDIHGFQADPLFVDPDGPDNVLGTADDDFHLIPGSPAQDAGNPLAIYAAEPASGNLVDLGAYGNSQGTLPTTAQRIQLVEPGVYRKAQVGQPVDIRWISSGLTNPAPVLLLNAGGPAFQDATNGRWSAESYRRGFSQTGSFTQSVDVSGVPNPPPVSVLQTFAQANGNIGEPMQYDIPLADGDYQIRLFFADPTATAANQRRFDITLQGQTVLTNYDIFADAGAVRKAVSKSFSFSAAQGAGLSLGLINRTSGFNATAIINAIEVTRVDPSSPSSFAVNLEFSPNNGQTWSTIATNLPSNRFGDGQFTWIANEATTGHAGIFRATAVGPGLTNVAHTTSPAISVAPAGNMYYVNIAGDSNFADNEYTTAAGDDLNSGTSPASPLASLGVLLRNYDLGPGDTVFVDSGTYNLRENVVIGAIQSGVRIQGPVVGSHSAVLNRGNTAAGSYVVQLLDATNVTLDSLELVGGHEGLRIDGASHDATLTNSVVRGNVTGVYATSTANRAVISQNDVFANTGAGASQPAILLEGDDARIEANLIHDNVGTGLRIDLSAANTVVRGNHIFSNPGLAIQTDGTNVLIESNSIHGNATGQFGPSALQIRQATVQDNVIFGHSKPGIVLITGDAVVQRNVIHDNTDGIAGGGVQGAGIIRDNRIYHNSLAGVRLTAPGAVVSENSIYANGTGVLVAMPIVGGDVSIKNNVIYDNIAGGIEVNITAISGQGVVNLHNNTIFEPSGTAVRLINGPKTDVRNNVLSTATGTLFNVANAAQAGLTSDYNVLHVAGSGRIGIWGVDNIVNRTDWFYELGRDEHSIEADPQFLDIDGPDNRRGYNVATSTDFGLDDDFRGANGSAAIDAGDPLSYYFREPTGGNRANAGAFGNTSRATPSSPIALHFVEPAGLTKFEVGQPIGLKWISAGFRNHRPVALINAGGPAVLDTNNGRWSAEAFRSGGVTGVFAGAVDTSLVANPPPQAVLQTFAANQSGAVGTVMRYDVPLVDGNYDIRLLFAEPNASSGANQRLFDVVVQGQTVLANFDMFANAGAVRKAIARSFAFGASQGAGLRLELINRTSDPAIIAGIEITAVQTAASSTLATNVEFSSNNGASWSTIATNVPSGRFGEGAFTWNATTTTNGNTGRFRLTAVNDGVPSIQQVSPQPFSIASAGTSYYVNVAADAALGDNEFTTASGDNANTGKSPTAPMKSLAAPVRAYDLDAGDTVFVDTGAYKLLTNVTFGLEDSGVRIQGPTLTGHAATLDRANTAVGSWALAFVGGSNITVDSLDIRGGEVGVLTAAASNIESRDSVIRNNSYAGVYIETNSANVRVLNNQIQENTSRGVEVRGSQVTIEGNLIRNSDRGVLVTCCNAADVTVRNNEIFGHNHGVELSPALGVHRIEGNRIRDNTVQGIVSSVGGTATGEIIGNEVFGHSGANDIGITVGGVNTLVRDNVVYQNFKGVEVTSGSSNIDHNRVFANSSVGINITAFGSDIRNNQVYSNATGILYTNSFTVATPIRNNLIYSNTNVGIDVAGGVTAIIGNTVYHPVGTAVRYTGTGTGIFKNNIVQGDVGTLVSVAAGGQVGFISDRNLLYATTAAANIGQWGSSTAATLAAWRTLAVRDANSVSADPLFLDINGADNVLGGAGTAEGDGADDNFHLRAGSPAIDRGDTWAAPEFDSEGSSRRDDLGTANAGGPRYVESSLGTNQFAATGVAQNHRQFDSFFTLNFPVGFVFPFYGTSFTSAFVSTNGFLQFGSNANASDGSNTTAELVANKRIAPLWDDLTTLGTNDDVFVDTTSADRVTIRWNATSLTGGGDVQFAVTLVNTGEIQFHYGPGNVALTPTIGISAGDGVNFNLAQYDGQASLATVASLRWSLPAGFTDIGAFEFLGSSLDTTPPVLVSSQVHTHGSGPNATSEIYLTFSEPIDSIDARSPANYQFVEDGADGIFDNGDDVVYELIPRYVPGSTEVTIEIVALGGITTGGNYRLRVSGNTTIHDVSGNRLDGDGNGSPGGDSIGVNTAPQLGAIANRAIDEGQVLSFTANATDANAGDDVTYSLAADAPAGASIHPDTGLFTWTPDDDDGPGAYVITVVATDNGSPALSVTRQFTVTVNDVTEATIAGRFAFYNRSAFDGGNVAANAADDAAIATDKTALLRGQSATIANYTSYVRGINGIIVDINNLASLESLSAADFVFRVGRDGNVGAWSLAPAPTAVAVREGAGVGGSDRVTITWADGAIANSWLQVTVLANLNTGLAEPDVHYWGNAIGETGNIVGDARADFADRIETLRNFSPGPVNTGNRFDLSRDRVVDAADVAIVDAHLTGLAGDLNRDDRVGLADIARLQSRFGGASPGPYDGDLNGDGAVNRADVALLAIQFGASPTAQMLADRLSLISIPASSPAAIVARAEVGSRRLKPVSTDQVREFGQDLAATPVVLAIASRSAASVDEAARQGDGEPATGVIRGLRSARPLQAEAVDLAIGQRRATDRVVGNRSQ